MMTYPKDFKPMKAINADDVTVQPARTVLSEKINGVRVVVFGGTAYSCTMKPLPNRQLQDFVRSNATWLEAADGELTVGNIYTDDVLQRSVSFAKTAKAEADFTIHLFDRYDENLRYEQRLATLTSEDARVKILPQHEEQPGALAALEREILLRGGEGVMRRDATGWYHCGRSGKVLPELQKIKRFHTAEGVVVGYAERQHNTNAAYLNECGYTKRSTAAAGKVGADTLGSLCLLLPTGMRVDVSGFTAATASELWQQRNTLVGLTVTYKYFRLSPAGVPLLPTFVAFRPALDITDY